MNRAELREYMKDMDIGKENKIGKAINEYDKLTDKLNKFEIPRDYEIIRLITDNILLVSKTDMTKTYYTTIKTDKTKDGLWETEEQAILSSLIKNEDYKLAVMKLANINI